MKLMNNNVAFNDLSDKQKTLLTQLAYINLDIEKYEQAKDDKNIKINQLLQVLLDENTPYLGSVAEKITGIKISSKELIQEMIDNGLGDLEITGIQQDNKTGFYAMALTDNTGNTGITFRGTDVSNPRELILDSLTDANEYITNNDKQVEQAIKFFEQYAGKDSSNFLFGHSLGGNLVEHIMAENTSSIGNAFVINPEHISQDLLNTEEKIKMFNDPEKFSCYVIGGDWVSDLRESNLFQDNIKYIKNNNSLKRNILSDHAVEAASINELGDFEITSREDAYKGHKHTAQRFFTIAMSIAGKVAKVMHDSSSAVLDKIFSREDKIIALPESSQTQEKKDTSYIESLKLENFETTDKSFNVEQARKNLSTIRTFDINNTGYIEEISVEHDEH